MKQGCCRQHKNQAQIICLHNQCTQRLMCMLCQHNHQFFTSVRNKNQVQLKRFKRIVDQSVDRSLKIIDSIQQGGIEQQKKLVTQYYTNIKQDFNKFLDLRMNQNLALFTPKSNSSLQFLIRSRIQGRYHQLPSNMFMKIKQVYQGKDLQTLARQQQQSTLQVAYNYMQEFHSQIQNLLTKFKIQFKIKIPQIRIKKQSQNFNRIHVQNYNEQIHRNKQKQNKKYQTNIDIQMMLTDAYSNKKSIFTIGWDKILRIFDKNLKIIHSKQYNNVLTRIQSIGDDIYAIGVSKQLHINKISYQDSYQPKQILILKGHTQKIWDISSFNTRIIGSCSQQGTKIWDLYKQRCQYTLRQQINPSCIKFMPQINYLAVGYHNHNLKIYSINNMKPTRSYQLPGVPLYLSQQNRNQNLIYCSGFNSDLKLFDMRITKQVFTHNFKSEAITTFKQSIFDQQTLLVGQRGGKVRIFDLRKLKTRLEWDAHKKMTNLSKPNGVIRIFEEGFNQILTVGCNDKKAIIWEIKNQQ